MGEIEDFVQVNISRKTRALDVKSFTTPLILAYHTHYSDLVREYNDADQLLDDGFLSTDKAYLDALAVKAQGIAKFKVGRRSNPDTQTVHVIPVDTTDGAKHVVTLNGVDVEVTNPTSASVATVVDEIVSEFVGVAGVTVTDANTHAVFTAAPGVVNRIRVTPGLKLLDATTNGGIVADLAAIFAADDGWYSLALDNYSAAVVAAAAVWVESKALIMAVQSADWNVKDQSVTNDIASNLKAASYTRLWGSWCAEVGGSRAAAWAARVLKVNPGVENPAHKLLAGQTVDALSPTERAVVLSKRFSVYESTASQNHTFDGRTPSGEFIDQIIGSDWIRFRMQEEVFSTFINNANVPQTNGGIAMVESAVRSVLKRASSAAVPILDPESIEVSVPDIADVPQADRLSRNLPDITWIARFQGSFNTVKPISGTISV